MFAAIMDLPQIDPSSNLTFSAARYMGSNEALALFVLQASHSYHEKSAAATISSTTGIIL